MMNHRTLASAAWLAWTVAAPTSVLADDDSCAALALAALDNVTIDSAVLQPEGAPVEGATIADATGTPTPVSGLPVFCRVVGSAQPEAGSRIGFEVWLPAASDWEGRFLGGNNGGFAGYISYVDLAAAVTAGYASASTDTGHIASTDIESSWAKGRPELVRDYGWRGVHVTTVVAKDLIRAYYGRAPDYSYFIGCSNGGRQGLMEAWRYPEDYDGIIAGAPAWSLSAMAAEFVATVQAQASPGAAFTDKQTPLLQSEVLAQCDGLDGRVDGVLSTPRACRLDTTALACGTASADACFTPPQIAALEQIYAGRRDRNGRRLAWGYRPSGLEAIAAVGWANWMSYNQAAPTAHYLFARGWLQDLIPEPFATPETFDFERDLPKLEEAFAADLDVQPQLDPFFERGGKLILWQGLADPGVPAQLTRSLHRKLERNNGADAALRLFEAPGVLHCGRGSGPDLFGQSSAPPPGAAPERNLAAALEAWVESDRAPDNVIGTYSADQATAGTLTRESLICAFPGRAELRADADPSRAASYACSR
jgi:pimeloyl-ACP methyl ester carboxylesterase